MEHTHTHTHVLVAWGFSRSGPRLQKGPPSVGVSLDSFPPLPALFLPIGSPLPPSCHFTHIRGEGGTLCNWHKWPPHLGSGEGLFGSGGYLGKSESLKWPAPLGSPQKAPPFVHTRLSLLGSGGPGSVGLAAARMELLLKAAALLFTVFPSQPGHGLSCEPPVSILKSSCQHLRR